MKNHRTAMSFDVATAIKAWYEEARMSSFRCSQKMMEQCMKLGSENALICAHVIREFGPNSLLFTARGLCVTLEIADQMLAESALILASKPGTKLIDAQTPPSEIEKEPTKCQGSPKLSTVPTVKRSRNKKASTSGRSWTLCDEKLLETEISRAAAKTEILSTLRQLQSVRVRQLPLVTDETFKALRQLAIDFPNFGSVIDQVETDLYLARFIDDPIHVKPMLLLGPPGAGKTEFMRRLAEAMSMSLTFLSAAEITAGWVLSGLSAGYRDPGPGIVAKGIIGLPAGKSLLVAIDEIDKVPNSNMPMDRTLLGLLEPGSARAFRDEYLGIPIDTRPVSWLLTANRIEEVKPELLSRLRVFEIAQPSSSDMPAIVRSIDASLRRDQPKLTSRFEPLSEELIKLSEQQPPRVIRQQLQGAYAAAVRELGSMRLQPGHRLALRPHHIKMQSRQVPPSKKAMGFIG